MRERRHAGGPGPRRDQGMARGARLGAPVRGHRPGRAAARLPACRQPGAAGSRDPSTAPLLPESRRRQVPVPYSAATPYLNTIPPERELPYPGDQAVEHSIRAMNRWNALAVVLRANKESSELGGHIASFQSAATLYDVGYNHFWRGASDGQLGDSVYFQGHSSPGFYGRAYLEGRLTEAQMDKFRQETGGDGLPSYPHPWLMPDFWQF